MSRPTVRTFLRALQPIASTSYRIPPIRSIASRPPRPGPGQPTGAQQKPSTPHPSFPPIAFDSVSVVDPETNALRPPQPLRKVLAEIDTNVYYPLLVSSNPPVVRIKNVAEHIAQLQAVADKVEAKKKLQSSDKEIQVPWTSADGDVKRKIELARKTLQGGDRAQVIFAPKVGGGVKVQPTRDRQASVVQMFDEELKDLGNKWRTDEVTKKIRTMYFEPLTEVKQEAEKRLAENTKDNKKQREEKKEARRKRAEEKEAKQREQESAKSS